MPKFSLVVPTMRVLNSWVSYADNFKKFGHNLANVKLIVVDDYCPYVKENVKLLKTCGVPFEFWTIERQKHFFKDRFGTKWQEYWQVIPHHTDACRSFGYLIAMLDGADTIITWDDDNWAINSINSSHYDYLSHHSLVNKKIRCIELSSSNGYFNTCSLLKTSTKKNLYPRGYPYSKHDETYQSSMGEGEVVVNVGLWTGNPDVDAITILNEGSLNGLPKTRTIGLKSYTRIMLAKGTFAPINTANTAYSSKLLPCIYDTYQGVMVGEFKLDRYGDIWCNHFIKKIVDAVGGKITIGAPLVEHKREPRDTMIDFQKEIWGMLVSQKLFDVVESIEIESKNYSDAYSELIQHLSDKINVICLGKLPIRKYLQTLLSRMNKWLELIEKLSV